MVPGPSNKQSTSSFTKFAAHFSPSQSKKSISSSNLHLSSSQTSLPTSATLQPPNTRPSCESGSSAGSRTRSTTPRGTRPVIRVSMTDKDLFTQDVYLRPSSALKQTSGTAYDSDLTPSPSPSSSPVLHSSEPTVYKRGQTPASILAAAIRDQEVHKRQPSTSSKNSRQTPESERSSGNDKDEGKSIPRLSAASPRPFQVPGEKGLAPSLSSRRASVVSSIQSADNSSLRSRIKQPCNAARSKPPSIPLPDLPPTPPSRNLSPTNLDGFDLSGDDSRAAVPVRLGRRPRAHTISSLPELPTNAPGSPLSQDMDVPFIEDDENVDIDSASAVQLRQALRSRNKQFEELAAFTLKKEEQWSAERKNLEKKISSLQRELVRRESEITGLKLIISEDDILKRPKPLPAGILNQSRLSSVSTSPSHSDYDSRGSRRINYQSDSGAESTRGSGTESVSSILRGHNNSNNNRNKKTHQRSSAIGEFNYLVRTSSSSIMRQPKFPPGLLLHDKAATESPYSKRMSLLSMTSASSSSGSSSLIPPSPSMTTMSSLSAIPEVTSSSSLQVENDGEDGGRARRASHRISASSIASSSTAASSSAYSTNIKRSRPPSIAQVLEKSPNMDDVLEKLRPFA